MSPRAPGPTIPLPPGDDELCALYREGCADDGPPPALDTVILAAGRAAVREAKPALRRPRPWWQGWLAPVSVLAVAAVGLTLSLHVAEDPEYDARERRPAAAASAPKAPAPATAPSSAPAPTHEAAPAAFPAATQERASVADKSAAAKKEATRPVPAEPPDVLPAGGTRPDGPTDSAGFRRDDAPPRPSGEGRWSGREEARDAAAARPAASPAPLSIDAPASSALGRVAEKESSHEADRAVEAKKAKPASPMNLQVAPPRPVPELKKDAATADSVRDADRFDRRIAPSGEAAKRSRQEAVGTAAPAPASAPAAVTAPAKALQPAPMPPPMIESREAIEADPARWIDSIRRLRAAGLDQEAAAEIARLRSRYPDVRLPADLAPR